MKVYYREGDEVFYGDLMYITEACEYPFVNFDTHSAQRKRITIKNPTIVAIGISRIHIKDTDGNDYAFYTEQPDWVVLTPNVAAWAKEKKRVTEEDSTDDGYFFDVLFGGGDVSDTERSV